MSARSGWLSWQPGPVLRVSFGLMSLLMLLVLVADLLLGAVPGRGQAEREIRKRTAENLAVQLTGLLQAGDHVMLGRTIQQVLARNPDLRAIRVHRTDGSLLLERGETAPPPVQARDYASDIEHLRVPVMAGTQVWGGIDLTYAPIGEGGVRGWLRQPGVQLLLVLGIGGWGLSHLYLRRVMQDLNPSAAVPDRVRQGFDHLSEGLLILDRQARIVLANAAFRRLSPDGLTDLSGKPVKDLTWLADQGDESRDAAAPAGALVSREPPWLHTLHHAEAVGEVPFVLRRLDGEVLQLLVSSAPVTDAKGRLRGCLVSFSDRTALHRSHAELSRTVAALERSRVEIEAKNEELQRLASRDPMTGCYNRRAFFEVAEQMFAEARANGTALCCLMTDIDFFKKFNDQYGHAIGDQVIQIVAKTLTKGIRQGDMLCRYGGEEFCIVLPGATPEEAVAVAERIRIDIHDNAQGAIRDMEVRRITSSFGMASLLTGAQSLKELIDQADQALYKSKEAGRNCVTAYRAEVAEAAEA